MYLCDFVASTISHLPSLDRGVDAEDIAIVSVAIALRRVGVSC